MGGAGVGEVGCGAVVGCGVGGSVGIGVGTWVGWRVGAVVGDSTALGAEVTCPVCPVAVEPQEASNIAKRMRESMTIPLFARDLR